MKVSPPTVLFHAESFGFGPASITIAVARQLRSLVPNEVRFCFLGNGVATQLAKTANIFCAVYEHSTECMGALEIPEEVEQNVLYFLTTVSPTAAKIAQERGWRVGYVDPLFWFFNSIPSHLESVDHYFVQQFESTEHHRRRLGFSPKNLLEVDWIVNSEASPEELISGLNRFVFDANSRRYFRNLVLGRAKTPILVNFGGVDSYFSRNSCFSENISDLLVPHLTQRCYVAIPNA